MNDRPARDAIRTSLGETLFVEAGAGSGKTSSLVDRVIEVVLTDGVPLRHVAAVTFTDKAAAELRDRLRKEFSARVEPAARDALSEIDTAAIGTLHSFAQRILTEHPIEAGLPPLLEIRDEVASGVDADARWSTMREDMLDDATLTDTLMLALAGGVKLPDLRAMAATFNANWDLLESRVLHAPVPDLQPIDVAAIVQEARRLAALADGCTDDRDALLGNLALLADWAEQLHGAHDDPARLTALGTAVTRNWHRGRAANWSSYGSRQLRTECKAVADAALLLRSQIVDVTLRRLAHRVATEVLQAARARRAEGRLEFHDLLVMARELVRSPTHGGIVRHRLQQRYRRLLLDEFQDTDPIQIELAVRIAGGAAAIQDDWADVRVPGGSLFFVGDPKQSIYRFRRADIATYLQAQRTLGREVVLDANFRTTAPILDWVNTVFGRLIVASPDSQPPYRPLAATRPAAPRGPAVATVGTAAHTDNPNATTLREREAADVVAAVRTALAQRWQVHSDGGWRDIELRDIAVLVPSRTSLPQLENALDEAGIGYHPGATSLVYRTREIRDLLTAARACDDPSDELALVSALRSPLFGCGDDDLWTWKEAGNRFSIFADASGSVGHPVASALDYLRGLHNESRWRSPGEVLTRLIEDRRMFEQAVGFPRTRDVWRRLRFVVDQARAWSESEHGSLRAYLAWAARQGSDTARVAEAALPETDADTLKIMTIHSAKGLEFPMVIVSGMTTRVKHTASGLQVLWPRDGGYAMKLHSTVKTADFDAAQPVDEQMGKDEKMRLLYVACTRARDHLVVSLHRKGNAGTTNAELLANASPPVTSLSADDGPELGAAAPRVVPTPPPSPGQWAAMAQASRTAAARSFAVTASGLEGTFPSTTMDPGLAKGPRNLELAPWYKGRYGTAIGRAVHGVLQSVDLGTGDGLDAAIAAQALAEGVVPYTDLVGMLSVAALASPLVRRAATRRHWRETWVATAIGDKVLEGIVDLLYEDDDGLVIVDYKTDTVPASALSARTDYYRPQMAAYATALEAAVGRPVARCVLLFLHPGGAEAWEVPELDTAKQMVRVQVLS
ncbi:UvrD-helicase domain-containing protein [Actinoplanes sp. NPDC051633]|uniref:UvrD-helicase domain-containing protein n=1 Tax=Actinoplanes sp. NPDC051633 TaxID=3155670 RepID=UPI0034203A45